MQSNRLRYLLSGSKLEGHDLTPDVHLYCVQYSTCILAEHEHESVVGDVVESYH